MTNENQLFCFPRIKTRVLVTGEVLTQTEGIKLKSVGFQRFYDLLRVSWPRHFLQENLLLIYVKKCKTGMNECGIAHRAHRAHHRLLQLGAG